ncbi:MAG: VIT domain-containing protein [Candidatus Eiseniibacteriota bacterium]
MQHERNRGRLRAALAGLLLGLAPVAGDGSEAPDPARPLPGDRCGFGGGALQLVVGGNVQDVELPLARTAVKADVSGPVARVTVTQTFQNPYEDTIEAVYVFPLPHEAAVNDLEMRLGERVIRGIIERRDEARRLYESARDRGHVAALLEQERPNIFTQSVANILPGNDVVVTLTYVETLAYDDGRYELAFPTVVGPRFIPPGGSGDVLPAGGFAPVPSRGVPDADYHINPDVLPPGFRSGHDLAIEVHLDAGLPVHDLESPTHVIRKQVNGARADVRLDPLDTIPNKDFVLRWRVAGDEPAAAVLTRNDGEQGFVTVMIHPERSPSHGEIGARELVFVLDCSGSMSGEPIAASKALVRHALRNLRPGDTFQVIRFSDRASGLASAPQPATPDNVKRAIAYVDGLEGEGGTMMIEGIRAALGYPADPSRLRIVAFLTDGYIGNENEILGEIRGRVGGARLFSFGVGSSVNRFLLDRMSEEGRGEVQYFLPGSDVRAEVAKFTERIDSPCLTDIELSWEGLGVRDAYPARVPDLFAEKPLVIHARTDGAARDGRAHGKLRIRGRLAGRPWERTVVVDLPRRESGSPALASLWARARIADLEREQVHGETADTVSEITDLGLRHRLVTQYTSFVAVEETTVVSNGVARTVRVPVPMPEGVSYEGVFGELDAGVMPGALGVGGVGQPAPMTMKSLASTERVAAPVMPEEARRELPASRSRGTERAMTAVQLRVSADGTELRLGEKLRLTIEVINGSRYDVRVPAVLLDGSVKPAIRVIDGAWNEATVVDRPVAGGSGVKIVPAGATETITIVLDTEDARFFHGPGIYHLILPGADFGAVDSNRITIRITA